MPKEGRQEDPRKLSEETPGRSKNQDNPPSLPPADAGQRKAEEDKQRFVPRPPADEADLERRDARGHSAMPYGRRGSRRGRRLGTT